MFFQSLPRKRVDRKGVVFAFALIAFLILILSACGGGKSADPAGTSTQDPPIPQLTQSSHGILDTTGTLPQSFISTLQTRSDQVEADGFQIAVVFFNDLAGDPHQFATDVFNKNGIGYKDTNNGVLFVVYLKKTGKDGHAPWLSFITGGGISGSLPDTMMDDFAQSTFVPDRAKGDWQTGLLAFYDKVHAAEKDPNVAQEWKTAHPNATSSSSSSSSNIDPTAWLWIIGLLLFGWLGLSGVVAIVRRQPYWQTAFGILGAILDALSSGSSSGGSSGGSSSGGSWGGGGSSPSSGGDV